MVICNCNTRYMEAIYGRIKGQASLCKNMITYLKKSEKGLKASGN
jgi:hypothetical protein